MKSKALVLIFSVACTGVMAQNALFLHHSTGGNVFYEGNVGEYFMEYNDSQAKSYQITERAYPDSPYPWENYPYDYWNLWVNHACDNSNENIMCLDGMTLQYDVIILKHCFPGAGLEAGNGEAEVNSPVKTLANYKLQYNALLSMMDQYPGTKFIVWTLAPLHRNATNSEQAGRAYEFVQWVKDAWLLEDGKDHPNVYIFDFFSLAAEMDPNPVNGAQYCLKYDYEGDHEGSDSHPNTLANETIGPVFAQFVIDVIEGPSTASADPESENPSVRMMQKSADGNLIFTGRTESIRSVDFFTLTGAKVFSVTGQVQHINANTLHQGIYLVQVNCNSEKLHYKVFIQ